MSTGSGGAYSWQQQQAPGAPLHATWNAPQRPHPSHPQEIPSFLRNTAPPPTAQAAPATFSASTAGHASTISGTARPESPKGRGVGGTTQNEHANGIPDPPQRFPELETMSIKDLRTLYDERAKFEDFISKHDYQRKIEDRLASLRTQVETLEETHRKAQEERQAASSALRSVTPTTSSSDIVNESDIETAEQQVKELEAQVLVLQKEQDEWYASHSPERLMERLRVGIADMERESEALEKSMLSSSMNFEDFLTQYMECRKKFHERCLKLEQLKVEAKQEIKYGR